MPKKGQRTLICTTCTINPTVVGRKVCSDCYAKARVPGRRASTLKQRYGITEDQYNIMLEIQNGKCAICKKPETSKHQSGKVKHLAVDHRHLDGKIRGLLCKSCNQSLGLINENSETALNMAAYIKEHN